jgi:hypothetical protein
MAAPALADIREAMKTALSVIPNVQPAAYKPGNPTYPCVFVFGPDEVDYHQAMRSGLTGWSLVVMALAGANLDEVKFRQLDPLISETGESSVKAALEADTTLGGLVNQLVVRKFNGYRTYTFDQLVWGCDWTVDVYASGS